MYCSSKSVKNLWAVQSMCGYICVFKHFCIEEGCLSWKIRVPYDQQIPCSIWPAVCLKKGWVVVVVFCHIQSYSHSYNTFGDFHSELVCSVMKTSLGCRAELRCILKKLRCTILYRDALHPKDLRCTLGSYAAPKSATLHPKELRSTQKIYAPPYIGLRSTLKSYAEPYSAALHPKDLRYTYKEEPTQIWPGPSPGISSMSFLFDRFFGDVFQYIYETLFVKHWLWRLRSI